MLEIVQGDLLKADTEALVNAVNCDGIMGKGIALRFKQSFAENFAVYRAACMRKEVQPGKMFVFATKAQSNPRFIINFPTKLHWRGKSSFEYIESGLADLVRVMGSDGIKSVAIPALGCGNGGLDWDAVLPKIRDAANAMSDVKVLVYTPQSPG